MAGKEVVQFNVKGPISVQCFENGVDNNKRVGCSIIDLNFHQPCQFGELVFTNYYTSFVSIYVKRLPANKEHSVFKDPSNNKPYQLERSATVDFSGSGSKVFNWNDQSDEDRATTLKAFPHKVHPNASRRHKNATSLSIEFTDRPWECSIHMKTLMPWPHFESGSQDVFSIQTTESLVEWRDVLVMRLVIHQPSSVWKRFSVEDINIFRNLPKKQRGSSQCEDVSNQKDAWFLMLKGNTKRMLSGQLVEPEVEKPEERNNV